MQVYIDFFRNKFRIAEKEIVDNFFRLKDRQITSCCFKTHTKCQTRVCFCRAWRCRSFLRSLRLPSARTAESFRRDREKKRSRDCVVLVRSFCKSLTD